MSPARQRVLFVCLGNACRSQMAECFATAFGGDVLIAASAGLTPAYDIPPDTQRAMEEKGLDLRYHFPKHVRNLSRAKFDVVVNMSGREVPVDFGVPVRIWDVEDPICLDFEGHCEVRDEIERRVKELIAELRRGRNLSDLRLSGFGRV